MRSNMGQSLENLLRKNTSLRRLFLMVTSIGRAVTENIARGVKENHTLSLLDLRWNQILRPEAEILWAARNPSLCEIRLDGCPWFSELALQDMEEARIRDAGTFVYTLCRADAGGGRHGWQKEHAKRIAGLEPPRSWGCVHCERVTTDSSGGIGCRAWAAQPWLYPLVDHVEELL
eukprot:Rmarinus@m.19391